MDCIIISALGPNYKDILEGVKQFSANKVILICDKTKIKTQKKAEELLTEYDKNLVVRSMNVNGNPWEDCIKIVTDTVNAEKKAKIIICAGVGDLNYTSSMATAAFVNGLKAYTINNEKMILLPLFKFAYFRILTDRKLGILKLLYESDQEELSLEEINKQTSMSLPLISYHVNGNPKSEGLKKIGLITSREQKGKSYVKLSTMGKLLISGYLPSVEEA